MRSPSYVIIAVLIVLVALGSIGGYKIYDTIKNLEDENDSLTAQVSDLKTQVDSLKVSSTSATQPALTPNQTVETFYNAYMSQGDSVLRSGKYTTSELNNKLSNATGPSNPVICAQDNPPSIHVDEVGKTPTTASETVISEGSSYPPISVNLNLVYNTWLISNITCQNP